MFENTPIEDGTQRVREALDTLEKRFNSRRKQLEKRFDAQRRDFEKRARKLRTDLEKNPTVKRLDSFRKDARKQVEQATHDFLETLSIASKSDVQRIDRKLTQLNRKLKDLEKSA